MTVNNVINLAGGSEPDYEPILMDLEFQPSDSEQQTETVTIPIIDDEILENSEEELSLVLSSTDTSVIFSPEETSIVIVDDDGKRISMWAPLHLSMTLET